MQIECKHCGAPFDVQPGAHTVPCPYCKRANEVRLARQPQAPRAGTPSGAHKGLLILIPIGLVAVAGLAGGAFVMMRQAPGAPSPSATTPASVPADPDLATGPAEPEAPKVQLLVKSYCLVDANGDEALDLAGLFTWTDAKEEHVASIADGKTGEPVWRGPELPDDSNVICGADRNTFAIDSSDFKLRVFSATDQGEPVVRQLDDRMSQYAAGEGCVAVLQKNEKWLHVSNDGKPLDACDGARLRHAGTSWGAAVSRHELLGGAPDRYVWVGAQDGRTYLLDVPESGTKFITVTAKRGDVSDELDALYRADAGWFGIAGERYKNHARRSAAKQALATKLDELEEAWSVRLAIAADTFGSFEALLTPTTLVVAGEDPSAQGEDEHHLVGVGLERGSIRYTLKSDRDTFTLRYNGVYALADGHGQNHAFEPDTGERAFIFGM